MSTLTASPFKPMAPLAVPDIGVSKGGSRLSVTRVGMERPGETISVAFRPEDAWYVVLQLQDAPPHRHWIANRPVHAPVSPRGCLQIVDLRGDASAIVEGPFDSLNVHIPRSFLNKLADDAGAKRIEHLAVPDPWTTFDATFANLSDVLLSALSETQEVGPLLVESLTVATALHLAERYGDLSRPLSRRGTLATWQERRAREMIAENLSGSISLADVAKECRLSLAHFSRAFKASTGETPHGWLQSRRIESAKALLTGSSPLSEIATSCGFADQSHFTRMFARSVGMTPGAWRRQL